MQGKREQGMETDWQGSRACARDSESMAQAAP